MPDILEIPISFWGNNKELPDPELVLLYKEIERREIWLDTEISWNTCSMIIKLIEYINETAGDDLTPIKLKFFSPGGEIQTMFALYHVIKTSRVPVHTINYGACHSAAFIAFLGGAKRTMLPDAIFVAHQGSGVVGGTFKETKAAMAQYEKDVRRMTEIVTLNSTFSEEEVTAQYNAESDWYIDYKTANERGILIP